ncbi:MAG: MerR family transcriptional regulator [Bdellovibrio sp.]|nr:MerR family transcriptional regulator [Bdellovibrio sp.]
MARVKKELFTIRQVIELTGVSEFTLRGWENRYNAFKPQRTKTGRRQYTLSDLQKARLLHELVEKNHRISDIAELGVKELEKMVSKGPDDSAPASLPRRPSKYVQTLINHSALFAWDQVQSLLRKRRQDLSLIDYVLEFILPTIQQMNSLVAAGHFSVAQEHILSALIKEQLILSKQNSKRKKASRSKFVLTTPEGDMHDMGLVISSALCSYHGVQTLFLGPSTPKKDLCETALRFGASHILLASTVSEQEGAKTSLFSYVNFLDRNLPQNISLLLAGRNTFGFSVSLQRQCKVLTSMEELIENLKALP